MNTPSVSIIGYGRFGRLWANRIKSDFALSVFDVNIERSREIESDGIKSVDLASALAAEVIFYCIPISKFESALQEHLPHFGNQESEISARAKLLIDTLSVKIHPRSIFERLLPERFEILLTHPMFGPDSAQGRQRIVLNQFKCSDTNYNFWKDYFNSSLDVIELTAEEHDKQVASSQGLTHLVGRILEHQQFTSSAIDTESSRKLLQLKEQICKDEMQLFLDMQNYNPYAKAMRQNYLQAQEAVFKLLE